MHRTSGVQNDLQSYQPGIAHSHLWRLYWTCHDRGVVWHSNGGIQWACSMLELCLAALPKLMQKSEQFACQRLPVLWVSYSKKWGGAGMAIWFLFRQKFMVFVVAWMQRDHLLSSERAPQQRRMSSARKRSAKCIMIQKTNGAIHTTELVKRHLHPDLASLVGHIETANFSEAHYRGHEQMLPWEIWGRQCIVALVGHRVCANRRRSK